MKIICIGKNYVNHAKEMGSEIPKEPLFFLKPDSAILPKKHPFFIPDFSKEIPVSYTHLTLPTSSRV